MDFQDFGPQPICVLTEQTKPTIELEPPVEPPLQSVAQALDATSDLTDSSEMSQSGSVHSVSEPISIPTTRAFELPMDLNELEDDDEPLGILPCCPLLPPENVQWRPEFTSEQLHHIKETKRMCFRTELRFLCSIVATLRL